MRPVRRRVWLVVAIVTLCTAGAYVYSARQAKVYEASTKVLLSSEADPLDATGATEVSDRVVQDQATLLTSRDVATAVSQRLGRDDDPEALAASVTASAVVGSSFITITARRSTPRDAATVANAFARSFIDLRAAAARRSLARAIEQTRRELDTLSRGPRDDSARAELRDTLRRLRVTQATTEGSASVVDPARPPAGAASPHPVRDGAIAFGLSLLGAIGLAFALEALNRRLRTLDEFPQAYDMPLLGAIPRAEAPLPVRDGHSAIAPGLTEPFRQLRTALELAAIDRPLGRILVTSAVAGEGKSTVVRNLAIVLREGGHHVAVVDMDLRRPAMSRFFEQEDSRTGLTDVLTGRAALNDALVTVPVAARGLATLVQIELGQGGADEQETVTLLPSGPQPADPQAVLAAERTRQLLEELGTRYDIVLIDSPPLLHVTDAISLAPHVDGMLVVGRLGVVTRDDARRLAETLSRLPQARPLGVVVNDVPVSEGRGYGYRYGYGYGSSNGRR